MSKLFQSGVPTDMDVRALQSAFPAPAPGDLISHKDIAAATGVAIASSRYRTVTYAWRGQLKRDHGLILRPVRGVGFRVLTSTEMVEAGIDKFTAGARAQQRGIALATLARRDQLDDTASRKLDHFQRLSAIALEASRATVKAVSLPTTPAQRPRLPEV
mgnify:CR=1 FL=1